MPRRKPPGWPKLMVGRRLASGVTAFYWVSPTWAVKAGFPIGCEPLGTDYGQAKQRADDILNPQFDAWRARGKAPEVSGRAAIGTFNWLVQVYRTSPRFRERPQKTQKDYEAAL